MFVACSSNDSATNGADGGVADAGGLVPDARMDATGPLPPADTVCAGACPASAIKHLVVIVQENHTFDGHFGAYCTAPTGSNPTCNDGPSCCEAAPAMPAGATPVVLNDAEMGGHPVANDTACETTEMNGGKMDMYATASCGSPRNIAYADPTIIKPYWDLAAQGALADRYFQPVVGASSSNDMYFARTAFVFADNSAGPKGATGAGCGLGAAPLEATGATLGDLLNTANVPWTFYAGGYQIMKDALAMNACPTAPDACGARLPFYPCIFDPSDYPQEYYASTRDDPKTMRDGATLADDLANGALPAVSFVKPVGYQSEHPGFNNKLSDGVAFASGVVQQVLTSRYRDDTLILLTYDEGGGYFDHVAPPPVNAADGKPYGTRLPVLAMGPFARKNFVSHVVMEHSSIVKFVEWNWLGQKTGQLAGRDANVNNLGSLLDPATTGVAVPEH